MQVIEDVVGETRIETPTSAVLVLTVNGADTGAYGTVASWRGREWWVADYPSRDAAVAGRAMIRTCG